MLTSYYDAISSASLLYHFNVNVAWPPRYQLFQLSQNVLFMQTRQNLE